MSKKHFDKKEIRKIRRSLDLTQKELGALLGVHFTTISRLERGVTTPSRWTKDALFWLQKKAKEDVEIDEAMKASLHKHPFQVLVELFQKERKKT